ncbi:hypothetical protein E4U42_002033 [Claviceps africana]|uniref:Uncharacterized protein n=1 Tax=Claviceps africana TaxID=83212 RepID=A0A8K0NIW8_9HYPO|nr:hypothetical protein E4U42_002033 [Claviceps africana]
MAAKDDDLFELPKLRVSFGFEVSMNKSKKVTSMTSGQLLILAERTTRGSWAMMIAYQVTSEASHLTRSRSSSRLIRDEDEESSGCCCTWTRDPVSGVPYICTGGVDAKVKIYDATNGSLVRCFVGHGGDVNDLATSPIDSSVIASASDDTSIRIWSIDPVHREQPCLCILAGEGHSWGLLSVGFHDTGHYLLSSGHDQIINLWTLPDLPKGAVETPCQVHYPHFSTSAVHGGIVDW